MVVEKDLYGAVRIHSFRHTIFIAPLFQEYYNTQLLEVFYIEKKKLRRIKECIFKKRSDISSLFHSLQGPKQINILLGDASCIYDIMSMG